MIRTYSAATLAELRQQARDAPRRRAHLNIHETLDAPVQRLFIALEPDTYVRPHRHSQPNKWELFVMLEGMLDLLVFDDDGGITHRVALAAARNRAVEIAPNTWHALVCRAPGTLALEIKEGPYAPTDDKDFASWAPAENAAGVAEYLDRLRRMIDGDAEFHV